jgi:putative phosphoribosyl transferase
VPVAHEVAKFLNLPLDLVIVRKLQVPFNPEAGFGAMGPSGEIVFNENLLKQLNLSKEEIEKQIKKLQISFRKGIVCSDQVKGFQL